MKTKNLGVIVPIPRGVWQSGVTYEHLSLVRHKGQVYIAKVVNNNIEPNVTSGWENVWMFVVSDGEDGGGSSVTVDSELSDTSTNPVQNKVINEALDGKLEKQTGAGDSLYAYTNKTNKLVGVDAGNGLAIYGNNQLGINPPNESLINKRNDNSVTSSRKPVTLKYIDYAIKVGLTTNTLSLTDEEKQAAQDWLGASPKLYRHQIKLTKEDSEAKYMLDFTIINTSSTPLTTIENVADAISDGLVANEYHRPAYYEGVVPVAGKGLVSISRISSTISVYGCVIQSGTGPTELSFSINLPTEYGPGTTLLSIVDRPIEL